MNELIGRIWKDYRSLIIFLVLMFMFRSSFADWNTVPTGSMKPTIVEGDRILVNKMAYDLRIPFTHVSLWELSDPIRGDIVVFDSKVVGKRLVKRVIGVPGDTVALRDNVLYINGEELVYQDVEATPEMVIRAEHLTDVTHLVRLSKTGSRMDAFEPVVVPPEHYLVMGDNRDNSADSRVIGFVPRREIVGRSRMVVLSFNYDNFHLPRADRTLQTL